MALDNSKDDQSSRSWGERIREAVGFEEKQVPIKGAEDAVKKLKKRKGRA